MNEKLDQFLEEKHLGINEMWGKVLRCFCVSDGLICGSGEAGRVEEEEEGLQVEK